MTQEQLSMSFLDNAEFFPEEIWQMRLFYDLVFNRWTLGSVKRYTYAHGLLS